MMLVFTLYALAAAFGGGAVSLASSRAGHSTAHSFAHGCVAAVYFPLVALWAVWWAHRSALHALRGAAPVVIVEPHALGLLGESDADAKQAEIDAEFARLGIGEAA